MVAYITAIGVLGIVVLGLLIMTGFVAREKDATASLRRFVLLLLAGLGTVCAFQALVSAALGALKTLALLLVMVCVAIIGVLLIGRAILTLTNRFLRKNNQERGESWEDHG
jgi:hypothetical protein